MPKHDVYLEVGKTKIIAAAVDWPGWCRIAKTEAAALDALADCGPRYAQALERVGLRLSPPDGAGDLRVVERITGNATTDFGAPDIPTSSDGEPIDAAALERFLAIMDACWDALLAAGEAARGKELRKGPRGGGRELEKIYGHVLDAQRGYLNRIVWKAAPVTGEDVFAQVAAVRQDARDGLTRAAREGLPEQGPRGGKVWPARYFVRRSAWHILDHAWEIEDRLSPAEKV